MFYMSKQVGLPKIDSILKKIKIGPKSDIRPFCTKSFLITIVNTVNYINKLTNEPRTQVNVK